MNAKKFLSTLLVSAAFMSSACAAGADDELSIMAAEQRRDNPSDVETFEQEAEPVAPPAQPKVEAPRVEPPKDEPSSSGQSSTAQPTNNRPSSNPPPVSQPSNAQSTVRTPSVAQSSGMPNPIVAYNTFEECVEYLGYIPLYVPKQSGYALNQISIINDSVADLRFGRRWETTVNLVLRTYKRPVGEELRDISGVNGVKWRVDLSGGIPIYLARINENSNAAAWSVGQYTFAAMTDNLSFAAFRTLVFDELADLTTHYYIDY